MKEVCLLGLIVLWLDLIYFYIILIFYTYIQKPRFLHVHLKIEIKISLYTKSIP